MAIRYDGKQPSKLWYFWQKTKALAQTPFNITTRKDAARFGKDAGITAGTLVAANLLLGVPIIAATPILPWIIGAAAIMTGFKFGREAWFKFKALKETALVSNYVRDKENKWFDRKARGPLLKRIKDGVKAKIDAIPLGVVKAAKWLGLGAAAAGATGAAAGALSYAGVPAFATGAAATTVLSAIAQAGAVIGLTAAGATAVALGLAVAAIPAGIGLFVAARNAAIRRSPDRPSFGPKKSAPQPSGEPIEKGVVFTAEKGNSFDFNDSAKPQAPANGNDDALSEARRKAAEERARNRKGRDNSKRF